MFTKTFFTTRVTFAHTVAMLALGASLFVFQVPFTNAASASMSNGSNAVAKTLTTTELQTLITQLQNQIRELNSLISSTSAPYGAGMSVETTDTLRVRNSASLEGQVIGTQRSGAKGVVVEGPINQGGYTWIKVNYETGIDGWNTTGWLKNRTSPSNPVDGTFSTSVSGLKATVSFTLSNGCGGYVISWGDGTKTELAGAATGRPCTMAIVNVTKEHTYAQAGTYAVKVERFNGSTRSDVREKEIKVGVGASTVSSCKIGLESYQEGTRRTSITNTNSSQSTITDGYYVCRSGKWVIEGSLPKPDRPSSTSTSPSIIYCLSGLVKHSEGAKLQTITENGQTRTIADASFVCKGGKWVIEGSLPQPVNPECIKGTTGMSNSARPSTARCLGTDLPTTLKSCMLKTTEYKHGETARFAQSSGGATRPSNGALVNQVCQNGEWKSASSTSMQSGVDSNAATTIRNGSVRGASTDIMSEIGVTLLTIRSIITELK